MAVTYATVTSVGAGPGPRLRYEFYPETTNNTVTVAADNYTHVGPFSATTNAQGGFTVALPLNTDQGGSTLVWRVVETPLTQIPNRGLNARTIGYFTIPASIDYDDLVASAIAPTVVTPTIIENVGNYATAAQNSADAAAASAASVNREQANGVAGLDATGKLYETRIPTRLSDTSLASAYMSRTARAQHATALGIYFPEAEGAVGDGTTNDQAALSATLTAAAAARGQVSLKPNTTYALGSQLTIPANSRIVGNQATLKLTASAARVATVASNVRVDDVTFDSNHLSTSYVVESVASADTITLNRCRFTSSGGTGNSGFHAADGLVNLKIDGCTFDNCNNGVRLDKNADTVRIRDSYFYDWEERAIYVVSSVGFSVKNLWIEGNKVLPHRIRLTGGVPDLTPPRQPIAIQGVDTDLHRNVNVLNNHVIGPNKSYDDTTNPGTADQIAIHRTNGLVVSGNVSEYGGDVGITISNQSQEITVVNNIARFNDSAGICIGSAASTSTAEVTVVGNVCMNNGQNRLVDGPTWALNGINLNTCQRAIVQGNRCGDDQATKTQKYGITAQNTTDVTIGANQLTGNITSGFHKEGTTDVRLTFQAVPAWSVKAADQAVNNSTALVNATDLVSAVAAEGIYMVEAYLIYNATTTADMALKWTTPSGTMNWSADAPAAATTSSSTSILRTSFTIGSTAVIGGAGVNAVATPTGVLTVGSTSGNLQLQFAQNAAEVSDSIIRAGSWLRVTRIG